MGDQPVVTEALLRRWTVLAPGRPALGAELLGRWSEPHRRYHGPGHLAETLAALDLLGPAAPAEELALWFHDSVHRGSPGQDERESAALARSRLAAAGFDAALVTEVVRLVLVTIDHRPAGRDLAGARVTDADLAVLGANPERYTASVAELRAESPELDEAAWRQVRRLRVAELLAADPLFHTGTGRSLWHSAALANLAREQAGLVAESG